MQRSPEQRASMYTKELQTKLGLSPEQTDKVMAVNTECIRRKDAMKASGTQGGNGGFREIAAYRREQFAAILTPDQMAKLKEMNAQRRDARKSGGNGGEMNDPTGNQ